jgi:hypothetical protein
MQGTYPSIVRASNNDATGCQYIREAHTVPDSRNVLASRDPAAQSTSTRHAQPAIVNPGRLRVTAGGSARAK